MGSLFCILFSIQFILYAHAMEHNSWDVKSWVICYDNWRQSPINEVSQIFFLIHRKHTRPPSANERCLNIIWPYNMQILYNTGRIPFNNMVNFNPSMISKLMLSTVWGEVTYPFTNFNGCPFDVREWISNIITYLINDIICYPCLRQS